MTPASRTAGQAPDRFAAPESRRDLPVRGTVTTSVSVGRRGWYMVMMVVN